MDYKKSGVDYNLLDNFKCLAQESAKKTDLNIKKHFNQFGFKPYKPSRGESVFLLQTKNEYLAHVEEGLGTKNIIADKMYKLTGKTYYNHIAQDTIAMIVNDMITLGALPLTLQMHLAVGNSKWFQDKKRYQDLIKGWQKGCQLSDCLWAGGETPTLKGIVDETHPLLSGSAMGIVKPKNKLIKGDIKNNDAIIILHSSGIHANGVTLARQIVESLPKGYKTKLSNGRNLGETLLDPTLIYVPFIAQCLHNNIHVHYAVNITGHGWRKLMRLNKDFKYIIEKLPPPQPIFKFLQQKAKLTDKEAYATFNMGAGFAIYVPQQEVLKTLNIANKLKFKALKVGYIKKGKKEVIIKPLNITYKDSELKIR